MGIEINLTEEFTTEIVTQETKSVTSKKIILEKYDENIGQSLRVMVSFSDGTGETYWYNIWEGQEYIDAGQWTDEDVIKVLSNKFNITQ